MKQAKQAHRTPALHSPLICPPGNKVLVSSGAGVDAPIAPHFAEPVGRPAKTKAISIGGCNLEHALFGLDGLIQTKHFWRSSIPSLMSAKIELRSCFLGFKGASDFMKRETEKQITQLISDEDCDLLIFEAVADFTCGHIVKGDTIFADFRSSLFGEGWSDISFDEIDELRGFEVISADTEYYWQLWKHYFNEFYANILSKKISNGTKVILYARFICTKTMDGGTVHDHAANNDIINHIIKRNIILRDVYKFVEQYHGIEILYVDESLLYTSSTAPYGPWEFHPDKEAYCLIRRDLLNIVYPDSDYAERSLINWLAANGSERHKVLAERDAAHETQTHLLSERDALRGELNEANRQLECAVNERAQAHETQSHFLSERDALRGELNEANRQLECAANERAQAHETQSHLLSERDALRGELNEANRQLECAVNERAQAHETQSHFLSERDALRGELNEANRQLECAVNERAQAHETQTHLLSERDALRGELTEANRQLECAVNERAQAHETQSHFLSERDALRGELTEANRQLECAVNERAQAHETQTHLLSERDALRGELTEANRQLECAAERRDSVKRSRLSLIFG